MRILILFCLVYSSKIFSQQVPETSIRWMNDNLKNTNVEPKELLKSYNKYDFSSVWLTHQETKLGFIGDYYQRFDIHFLNVVKCDTFPYYYLVKGKSRTNNNICDFEGEIKILHIREINKNERKEMLKFGILRSDSDYIKRYSHREYLILAEYTFKENKNQIGSGTFNGIIKSKFYIKNGKVLYDDLDYGDSCANNQSVGKWKSYQTVIEKKCNWGDYRIPDCGDLDVGTAEFSPTFKYLKFGWKNYYDAYFNFDLPQKAVEKARIEEEKQWWK